MRCDVCVTRGVGSACEWDRAETCVPDLNDMFCMRQPKSGAFR
jgi:hypothetical protein